MLKAPAQSPEDPRAWLFGLIGSAVAFGGLCAIGVATQSFGFTFVVGAPFIAGFLIGRWVRALVVLQVLAVIIVVGAVILGAVTAELAGAICGAVFAWVATIPLFLGLAAGRFLLRHTGRTTSLASFAVVAVLIPLEPATLPAQHVTSVETEQIVPLSAHDAFDRITFYEDTSSEPPRLLRIALPRPIRTVGDASHVGDRPRCIYDTGYIVKEITAIEPNSYYAFKVIEQVGVESHAVKLVNGSFALAALDENRTKVVLTTRYIPKLTARIAWGPFERAVIRKLHEHVLREMMPTP